MFYVNNYTTIKEYFLAMCQAYTLAWITKSFLVKALNFITLGYKSNIKSTGKGSGTVTCFEREAGTLRCRAS